MRETMRLVSLLFLAVVLGAATCLGRESVSDSQRLLEAAKNGHVGQVRSLLESGVSPNVKDEDGRTLLHLAAAHGHQETARIVLEHGAELNVRDKKGRTALDLAEAGGHSGVARFLLDKGAERRGFDASAVEPSAATREEQPRELKPSLKFKTAQEFEKEIQEPAVFLDSENICFFAPKRRAKEAAIVFPYLEKAYDELYRIVGIHTEYKIAVYAFPKGNPHGWGGTSNCSIEYDDSNLDFQNCPEWVKYNVPHVSGYIEEMAHSFVYTTRAQFGWEMIGWSLAAEVSNKIAGNPILSEQVRKTRQEQRPTYSRYIQNGCVLPDDIPPNQCDRVHAWILRQSELEYGPGFWKDFFHEIRQEAQSLKDAVRHGDGDSIRNARYRITIDCFDRLPGLNFKQRLKHSGISLTTDVKSLHPEDPGWDRRLTE